MERIGIELIRLDGGTQPRGKLRQQQIKSYADDMRAGMVYPPVEVVYDGQEYWLWDGFHRVHASRLLGLSDIDANVTAGTQADAQWHSYSANRAHGLQRSNEDKRRAVQAALRHPQGSGRSDREVAEHVGVYFETVAKYRKELEESGTIGKSDSRTGRDGRTIKTANIGRTAGESAKRSSPPPAPSGAFKPVGGHSTPVPMVPLSLPRENPQMAASTLIELFDKSWLAALVERIAAHLQEPNP
jgi:ParB-like chromosome segregation protein Spo0J